MSAPTQPTAGSTGRKRAIVILLLAALAGGLAGIALDRLVLLPRSGHGFEHGPGGHPPRDREFRRRFSRELGLSADQQERVDSIMDRRGRELRAIRRQVQPQLDSIITRTRRELDSVLTPEQRKKAEELRRRHPRPLGPPPEDVPPGEPPQPAPEEPPS
jgi:Spy/CpxP family protein refolding chaperone